MDIISNLITQTLGYSSTLLFGSTGEIITEKSGNLNLGTPGIMSIGGVCGVVGAYFYTISVPEIVPIISVLITLLSTILGSLLSTLIYSFLTITLRANQNVTGLALTTFGVGLANFIGGIINNKAEGSSGISAFPQIATIYQTKLPFAEKLGFIGKAFLSSGFMTYLAIIIAILTAIVIKRTRVGLNLRAVGENPATADAAGINVNRYKYCATCLGGVISGLGGLHFVMQYLSGGWNKSAVEQFGWLSVALVIFAVWRPLLGILGSVLFGALYVIPFSIPNLAPKNQQLLELLPYVVTIVVLTISSMRKKREQQPPESLGTTYFREER
ncbi:MAG: ABC transporter permease [Acutalibacteraceae bacterium]|nr:ABC transporter permease [Acutalibacteraceae bacterium]